MATFLLKARRQAAVVTADEPGGSATLGKGSGNRAPVPLAPK
jgi:hypothetical protein